MEIRSTGHVSLALLSALLLVTACLCSREETGRGTVQRNKPLPDQVISDFRITETASGRKEWNMSASKAYIYDSRGLLETEDMEVQFFDEEGRIKSTLVADRGVINRATETQTLLWISKTREIVSDDSVRVVREGDVLTGVGFRGDPDLGSFEILKNMKATIHTKGEESGGGTGD
jgi:lipopolysaccharide export system protein LptC